jgi:peptidoglycan-associated lipoprotein
MQNILFEYDQALIRTTEIPKLQSATQFLIANPSVQLIVEGNADERGSQEYNIALGDERAAVVKKYFVDHGVTSSRLDALSYGEERPLCRQETEGCWQRNRRAQFTMKP